jgi:hypothetical protein
MGNSVSSVDIKVQKFILQYGSEQLIEWLDEFDYMGGPERFKKFKKIEKIACNACNITIADMRLLSKDECIDAKRIIAHIAFNTINFKQPVIAKLLGNVSLRSVGYYINQMQGWLDDPRGNKVLIETYNKVFDKFNSDKT